MLKRPPQCAPDGSKKKEGWRDVNPQCALDGSKKKEGWWDVTPQCALDGYKKKEDWRGKLFVPQKITKENTTPRATLRKINGMSSSNRTSSSSRRRRRIDWRKFPGLRWAAP